MFQGIISVTGTVKEALLKTGLTHLTVAVPPAALDRCETGASISIDGCCLSVTSFSKTGEVSFDLMQETLRLTSLSSIRPGMSVHVERSLRAGDEIGGHLLSGHVDGTATIKEIQTPENNHIITFKVAPELARFIFTKGYIALNGVSLTVANAIQEEGTFQVYLIPETLQRTTFGEKKVGDCINVEVDRQTQAIVETVERVLSMRLSKR